MTASASRTAHAVDIVISPPCATPFFPRWRRVFHPHVLGVLRGAMVEAHGEGAASGKGHVIKATAHLSPDELADVYGSQVERATLGEAGAAGDGAGRAANARTIASSGPKSKAAGGLKLGQPGVKKGPNPTMLAEREAIFNEIVAKQAEAMAALPRVPISVTMPDGKVLPLTAWVDSPLSVAESIGKQFAGRMCVAKVRYSRRLPGLGEIVLADEMDEEHEADGAADASFELWDLARPFEGDCELQLLTFDDPEGKETFWHSSSHVLGGSLEELFGVQLTHGPPTASGFFYDACARARAEQSGAHGGGAPCTPWRARREQVHGASLARARRPPYNLRVRARTLNRAFGASRYMGSEAIGVDEYAAIDAKAKALAKAKAPFERLVLSKADALRLFAHNPFKTHTIRTKVPDGALTTAYRCGARAPWHGSGCQLRRRASSRAEPTLSLIHI